MHRTPGIVLATILATFGGRSPLWSQSPLRGSLDAMHLASDSSRIMMIYAPADEARAHQVRALVDPMIAFYSARFGIAPKAAVAVLDSAHWSMLRGAIAPFPIPFVTDSPSVAVIAVDPLPSAAAAALRGVAVTPPAPGPVATILTQLDRDPTRMADLMMLARDALVIHEMGHRLTTAYGIATPRRWMSEFLANFWQQAYFAEAYPALDKFGRQLENALQGPPKPVTYTTLAELERIGGPPTMPVLNYEWFQDGLTARARDVYATEGLQFLTKMRAAFPRGEAGGLGDDEIVKRLEQVSPGWKHWAATFGADRR